MKKIIALILTVLMVASMVPAMALVSSAAESFELFTYSTGAETWLNGTRSQTQFLLGIPKETWNAYTQKVTWTKSTYNAETNTWSTPTITGGKMELTITDLNKKPVTVTCAPASNTSLTAGPLLHLMTAEYATPAVSILKNNMYTISDVKLYVGDEVVYQSSNSIKCSWKAGSSDAIKDIYVNGEKLTENDTFDFDPYAMARHRSRCGLEALRFR